ncbi:unnamed protein product [Microthlaspi erraticum]|uniref:HSF-type DNA-binding domain-containing protein n=1 Tax=Microthlaspi erraticum TaxID=1685480 RepID=A0A6D2HUW8_9BRAS|nr:unnamed protein product [Microthlaspi erraticum]
MILKLIQYISRSQSGKSLIVWNESEFARDVLPKCLRIKDMPCFTFQLEYFGFKKVESSEQWDYASDCLVRGKPELLTLESIMAKRWQEVDSVLERYKKRLFDIKNRIWPDRTFCSVNIF